MSGAISPLHHTSAWRGALLNTGNNSALTLFTSGSLLGQMVRVTNNWFMTHYSYTEVDEKPAEKYV
jgi:hypothetical protein